jgi:flagellar biosynthesis protein
VLVARGEGELAREILRRAQEQGIWVAQDPQLVALLSRVELEQEIPAELYTAVAVILSWVYWLRGMRPGDERRSHTS